MPWPFVTYAEPDFTAKEMGEYPPQTINIIEEHENGWALVDTYKGRCWVFVNDNLRFIDRHASLFEDRNGRKSNQTISPQVVKVIARDGDWMQIETWLGAKWINPAITSITISAAGDCTLGYDYRYGYSNSFMHEYERQGQDITYFFRNVKSIFEASGFTIVNLEGALTNAGKHAEKAFVFRGPPEFGKILSSSGVDAVSLANNHTYDYMQQGYSDTINVLEDEGISYFGNEYTVIKEVDGVNIGMFGFTVWDSSTTNKNRISLAIKKHRALGADLIIAYYHWGIEGSNYPNAAQKEIGRFSIDEGCDLVLGTHPHVLQGIEEYKGKNIVYSLGNFSFGGNRNPSDKDTIIFQQTFTFHNGQLLLDNEKNIIPILISSERGRNNFQPTVAIGSDSKRILERVDTYSSFGH